MTEILLPTDRDMGSAISLLHPIALLNRDDKNQQVFFDIENGSAICGFRRTVANYGVLLVRAQYGRGATVDIPQIGNMTRNGIYKYLEKGYDETNEGLLGREISGRRESVNDEGTRDRINLIREKVELRYEVDLSPNDIHQFIINRHQGYRHSAAYQNRKINLQFTAGLPVGTNQAIAEKGPNNEIIMISEFTVNGKLKVIKMYVDKQSCIPAQQIIPGRVYLVKPATFNKEIGERTCDVLRFYRPGVRIAVQAFERGLFKPGTGSYSVDPNERLGIRKNMIMHHNFMPEQKMNMIAGAPLITFDLDMFAALMNTLQGYPIVTLKFRDASSGAYFVAKGYDEYHPDIEAIIGQTIQYVRGRVWTP